MRGVFLLGCVLVLLPFISAWGSNKDRVRLEDVKAITLEQGKMTTGRRSSPVSQLTCVGGSAGCHAFQPKVVQCHNRGSDGYDVQWECKTDMDSAYRFGRIQVSCEGYDHPDDPYVLRGSCGLEYELDMTEEGYKQRHDNSHYRDDNYHHNQPRSQQYYEGGGFSFKKLIGFIVLGCVIYWALKCCCGMGRVGGGSHYGTGTSSSYGTGHGTGMGSSGSGSGMGSSGTGNGPGFWSGMGTGGMLGYMFGRGNRGWGGGWGGGSWGSGYRQSRPHYGGGWGSGWSSGGGGSGWSSSRRSGSSSSSRTTSGFGGTSRR